MISVEQIRLLESKVQKAVGMLAALQEENRVLKSRLAQYESRIDELEYMIEEFKEDQSEIEQGIISALNKLEGLEAAAKEFQGNSEESIPSETSEPSSRPTTSRTRLEPEEARKQVPASAEPETGPEPEPQASSEPKPEASTQSESLPGDEQADNAEVFTDPVQEPELPADEEDRNPHQQLDIF